MSAPTAPFPALSGPLPAPMRPPGQWVADQLAPLGAASALCLWTGWGAEARALRSLGLSITTADPLASSAWWNRALLADTTQPLSDRRLSEWLRLRKEPEVVKRFLPWANRYFTPEETIWLGIWHQHILRSEATESEKAIGVAAVYWTMRYWLHWNRGSSEFKPLPPSGIFRRYVEEANRMISGLHGAEGSVHRAEHMAPERALTKFPSDLLYCYVPPVEGIGTVGLTQQLPEQWTHGDPNRDPSVPAPGALGGTFSGPDEHLAALAQLLEQAEGFPHVALAYTGEMGRALEGLVSRMRPVLSVSELQVPYPGAGGVRRTNHGLLIAGAPTRRAPTDEGITE